MGCLIELERRIRNPPVAVGAPHRHLSAVEEQGQRLGVGCPDVEAGIAHGELLDGRRGVWMRVAARTWPGAPRGTAAGSRRAAHPCRPCRRLR
ncbi:hypothetical protein ACFPRL_07650 [Pseudoclavibacter helvolus]